MTKPIPRECQRCKKALTLVKKQAQDDALWFIAESITEAYLQQELRKLHAVIEGDYDKAN